MSAGTVIASFAVGEDAVEDGLGVVSIAVTGTVFTVYVNGGHHRGAWSSMEHRSATAAFACAMKVVQELTAQEAADFDEGL